MYVVNGIGGRFDQTLANVNTLYSRVVGMEEDVYLLSEDSLSFLLTPVSSSLIVNTIGTGLM